MHTDKVRFFRFFTLYSLVATCIVWFASYLFGNLPPEQRAFFGAMVPQVMPWLCGITIALTGLSATCFATLRSMVRPYGSTVEYAVQDERTNAVIEELRADLTRYRFRRRNTKDELERHGHDLRIQYLQARINAERRKLGIQVEPRRPDEVQ